MAQRSLEITIISAKGLKKVKHLSKMDVYATASISGDHRTEQKTPVNKDGGTSPKWNHPMKFKIDETLLTGQTNHAFIIFKIKCDRTLRGDREIGEVHVAIKELLGNASEDKSPKYVTYPVRKPSGKQKGELNFIFKFEDHKIGTATGAIATAYPVHVASSVYPPPQHMAVPVYTPVGYQQPPIVDGGGYGYPTYQGVYTSPLTPQQPPAGYPPVGPPGYGYTYPPVVQPEKPKDQFGGLGVEAAFVGGMLGGLLVGDLVSEAAAAAAYEPGFDAGNMGC
ncbi:hypothetical protein Dsin_025351 [Dipteronia sinensis]|uniref:C2 domain-containing protein n=1 Tax=Dipteronia sinensis TaxID=43782 RepID=A0AAE0DX19_9ROSI|nr:hypothetical protein Dsin_025351 [Dipteronia sinensis]